MNTFNKSYKTGALLMAVCGGKITEGIDFSDDMARLVIVVGIPYAMVYDPRVMAKKEYLTEQSKRVKEQRFKLTWDDWYLMKAMRTICQAVGRVIRHRYDYGAIALLDERLANQSKVEKLSKWLVDSVKIEEFSIKLVKPIRDFFIDRKGQQIPESMYEKESRRQIEEEDADLVLTNRSINKPASFERAREDFIRFKRTETSGARMGFQGNMFNNLCGEPENDEENKPPEISENDFSNKRLKMDTESQPVDKKYTSADIYGVLNAVQKGQVISEDLREQIAELNLKINGEQLQCIICFELKKTAQMVVPPCGHMICNICSTAWADQSKKNQHGKTPQCPTCKQNFKPKSLIPIKGTR